MIVGNIDDSSVVWSSKEDEKPTTLSFDIANASSTATNTPNDINNLGQIVGRISTGPSISPVFWSSKDDKPTILKINIGTEKPLFIGDAYGINDLGNIVGKISYVDEVSGFIPVFWSSKDEKPTSLKLNGGTQGEAFGINNLGQIVGFTLYNDVVTPVFWASKDDEKPTKLKLNGGTFGAAAGINNVGQLAGAIDYNGVGTPVVWASKEDNPTKLKLNGGTEGIARGINNSGQIVGTIVYNGVGTPVFWASKDDNPTRLKLNGGFGGFARGINDDVPTTTTLAATTTTLATTTTYVPPTTTTTYVPPTTTTTAPVISNICFPAGTLITTDQGPVAIERLDTTRHSIAGEPILHVVKTIVLDKYLICFPKHSIKQHLPTQETLISKEHKIFYQNKFLKASQFLDLCPEVKKVKYSGECLYNVLLANYTTMQVNNLTCETLHPKNMIAKLYLKNFTEYGRNQIIMQINKSLVSNNEAMYKSVTKQFN